MTTNPIKVTATDKNNEIHKNDFKVKEDVSFVRCVDFMVRMIEKYGHEIEGIEDKIA